MLRRKLLTILLICFMSIFLIAQPISAQDDTIKWRMASVWSGNLRALLDADEYFAERVEELSGGKLQIEVYPAGELCNANEVLDMVQNGVVEAGGVVPCYFSGKNTAFDLLCTSQVGMSAEDYMLWIYQGGGHEAYNKIFGQFNCKWFTHNIGHMESGIRSVEPIRGLEDLDGKKIRMSGIAQSAILKEFGAKPTSISVAELYEALRRGTLDGAEISNPYNDKTFHVEEVAKYWLTPGWHQTSTVYGLIINEDKYNKLSDTLKAIIKSAARDTMVEKTTFMAYNDAKATQFFLDQGVEITRLSNEEINKMEKVRNKVMERLAAENPDYKMVLKSMLDYMKMYEDYRNASKPFEFGRNLQEYPDIAE